MLRTDRRRIDSLRVSAAPHGAASRAALRQRRREHSAARASAGCAGRAAGRRGADAGLRALRPLAAGDARARRCCCGCGSDAHAARARPGSGFCFGAGTFGAGTWWLYISIHGFGEAPVWLTMLLIVALVAIMALYYALLGYLAARWLPAGWRRRAGCSGCRPLWLLVEWLRGWFLSGFPWLSLGYSPDRHMAGGAGAGARRLRHQRAAGCSRAGALLALRGAARGRAHRWRWCCWSLPWVAALACSACRLDAGARRAGDGGRRAGRDAAGHQVADPSNRAADPRSCTSGSTTRRSARA